MSVVVAALYKFVSLPDFIALREPLYNYCADQQIKGTLLLAVEGINGTIAGSREGIDNVLAYLRADSRFADLEHKESYVDELPFLRLKVKLKKEIVSMGAPQADPSKQTGTYVEAQDWNDLISDPKVLLIDTRNDYECAIGSFEGAVSPETKTFREFPDYVDTQLNPEQHQKVAMYCTGGIRCEKATAYLLNKGFNEVYHLRGGILKYLETVEPQDSLWQGECFVFDERVAVDHQLNKGSYEQCYACRQPLSKQDLQSPHYQRGISCPHCYDTLTAEKRASVTERQYQIELARQRNRQHLGVSQRNKRKPEVAD